MTGAVNDVRLGVVGYGAGGRLFHAPFVEAATGVTLAGVVTRSAARAAEVRSDWPGVPVYGSLAELLAAGVDAVTITTPPDTHHDLALEAIALGVHPLVDKPFAPSAALAREMADAAQAAGVVLNVFHNRRWDADIRTLARVLSDGSLGELWRVYSRMDQDAPDQVTAGPGHGLLLDLGSHVVDQLLWLLGPVRSVSAHLDWVDLPEGRTDGGFTLDLTHVSGVASFVESSKLGHVSVRELRAYGSKGSYSARGTDVQADAVAAGRRPADDPERWGYEEPEHWGTLATATGETRVPSAQGRWQDLYTQFAAAIRGDGEQPVPAAEAIGTLDVLDAARRSALDGGAVQL